MAPKAICCSPGFHFLAGNSPALLYMTNNLCFTHRFLTCQGDKVEPKSSYKTQILQIEDHLDTNGLLIALAPRQSELSDSVRWYNTEDQCDTATRSIRHFPYSEKRRECELRTEMIRMESDISKVPGV